MNKETDSRISIREEQITQGTEDPHAILGLGENATISDIKKHTKHFHCDIILINGLMKARKNKNVRRRNLRR